MAISKEEEEEYQRWIADRPPEIQELIKKYPPGLYIMKPGAPYNVNCEGTKTHLIGYQDGGEVIVVTLAEDKSEQGVKNEIRLCFESNKTLDEARDILDSNIRTIIDPKWMKLIKLLADY